MEKDNKQYRYQLEHCRGDRRKLICPNCGHRTFVPYIDVETGEYVSTEVGRCDRENSCGYHKTPKDFFQETGGGPKKKYWFPKKEYTKPLDPNGFSTISATAVEESMLNLVHNNFLIYLREHFPTKDVIEAITKYRIGTSDYWPGATIFWQIDNANRVRTGKIMLYNYKTGHRIKEPEARIMWAHKLSKIEGFQLRQCLFGLHLVTPDTQRVCVVESEKTAIIASLFFPEEVWLATGGLGNLRQETCGVLKGIQVILFPDLGAEEKWQEKAEQIPELTGFKISTWLQRNATPWQREHGYDIADEMEEWFPDARPNFEAFL